MQCCLFRLQSVLLYRLSVLLSAGMLRQYFVCLYILHAVWVLQCRSAPATCQPKPPTFLQLLLDMPRTFLSLCVTPQPSYLDCLPANNSLSVKSLETIISVIKKQIQPEDIFEFSYNISLPNNVFLLDWKWTGLVLLFTCWQLLSVWSTPIPSWQLQYKSITYLLFHHMWVIAHYAFLGQQHMRDIQE